jgi:hypothetical protein
MPCCHLHVAAGRIYPKLNEFNKANTFSQARAQSALFEYDFSTAPKLLRHSEAKDKNLFASINESLGQRRSEPA